METGECREAGVEARRRESGKNGSRVRKASGRRSLYLREEEVKRGWDVAARGGSEQPSKSDLHRDAQKNDMNRRETEASAPGASP